jgi:hypothetical protein
MPDTVTKLFISMLMSVSLEIVVARCEAMKR